MERIERGKIKAPHALSAACDLFRPGSLLRFELSTPIAIASTNDDALLVAGPTCLSISLGESFAVLVDTWAYWHVSPGDRPGACVYGESTPVRFR
jgi:hypothetical protein